MTSPFLQAIPKRTPSGRCFDDESHDEDCNRDSATKVSNVRVESFHAASVGRMSLIFFSLADG
ncbi:MAG: hypothetical protein VYE46_08205 [Cyanobacteriota bacterium]|nr:hypothetical protein [Cyanobacteriota bacterium]